MASLPRADLSVSSELHSMARMRAHARELSAKDAVWQGQLLGAAAAAANVTSTANVTNININNSRPPPIPPTPVPISLPLSVSPIPHSPPLCASPVSPGEMSGGMALGLSTGDRMITKHTINNNVKGKIRRKRLTKEEEAKFKPAQLTDLTGTTAARSRKMSREEHELMLHKRRLRNRESAARSRDRQRRTTADLAIEVDALSEKTRQLANQCAKAAADARLHHARAETLARANQTLLAQLAAATAAAAAASGTNTSNVGITANNTGNSPGVPRPAIPRAVVTNVSNAVPMSMSMSMPMSMPMSTAAIPMTSGPMSSSPAATVVPQSLPMSISGNIIGIPTTPTTSSGNLAALVPPHGAPQAVSAGMSSSSLPVPQRPPGASNPALSTDTIDRLLADQPLPHMTPSHSLLRIPSWPTGGGTFPNSL